MLTRDKALATHLIRDLFTFYIRNSYNPIQRGKGSPTDVSARKLHGLSQIWWLSTPPQIRERKDQNRTTFPRRLEVRSKKLDKKC